MKAGRREDQDILGVEKAPPPSQGPAQSFIDTSKEDVTSTGIAPKSSDSDDSTNVDNTLPTIMDPTRRASIEKSLKRKLDTRCSLFVLIYIMNYLDRNNIAAARLKGLQTDLNLSDTQYSTCLSILYVGYILMQVPSNIAINRISRPSLYISVVMLIWGLISTLTGNVNNFGSMVAIRFLLGFVEAAFLPGALLILSKWYTREELALRNAILFCGNLISNAFSALIGAGVLSNMDGVLGHAAWRWLFWIEGAITMAVALAAAVVLPDLPTNARGFTEEELAVAQIRMTEDVGEADTDSKDQKVFDGLVMVVKDLKVYVLMLTFTAYVVGLSFNAYFPTLTETLGLSYVPTLLMSAPPWVVACIFSLFIAWDSDRTQEKFFHITGPIVLGLVGFIISMSTLNHVARYIALFLQASSYAGFIVFYSWISSSFPRPPAKRAVALAMVNAFSQLGNVAGSYVWVIDGNNQKHNGFRKSYGVVMAMFGVTIIGCYIFRLMLVRLNRKIQTGQDAGWETHADVAARTAQVEGLTGVGDGTAKLKAGFRYLL
ncbi:MFS-type transporter-like protein 38 [Cladorrhinum sp. PSN332]|nr:MFS-type transporter-like protein 38 [Cladorrhinum sp. PSN332]